MPLHFGLLVFPRVQQLDLTGPYEIFASVPGATVHLIWKDRLPVTSSTGLSLLPTTTFADCPPLDVLCVPGGGGVNALLRDEEVQTFVKRRSETVRYLTAVCTGTLVLGAAGLLKGRRATTHWNAFDFLGKFGAIPVARRIVKDGTLITAGGVTSGIDFGLAVVAEIFGRTEAEVVQLSLEYAPEPPFGAGTPNEASAEVVAVARERAAKTRAEREAFFREWSEGGATSPEEAA